MRLKELSKSEQSARKPIPIYELFDAEHDRVHRDPGGKRIAHAHKHISSSTDDVFILLLAIYVVALSNIDALATIHGLNTGQYGSEINPIMRRLLNVNNYLFMFVKNALTISGVYILYKYRRYTAASCGLYGAAFLFTLIGAIHVYGLLIL